MTAKEQLEIVEKEHFALVLDLDRDKALIEIFLKEIPELEKENDEILKRCQIRGYL